MNYFIKKPGKHRQRYGLVCYTSTGRKTKVYHELPPSVAERLASINASFLSGAYAPHEAEALLHELIHAEYVRQGLKTMVIRTQVLGEANQKLFEAYWRDVYGAREQADEKTMRWKLQQALRFVEPLAVATASQADLFARLKANAANTSQRRHATDRLNQLLKYAGREFRLAKPPPEYEEVVYVTEPEFAKLCSAIEEETLRDFAEVLFGTGLRLSEALALTPADFDGESVNVVKQARPSGLKKPKRGKTGRSLVLKRSRKALQRWVKLSSPAKEELRFKLYDALEKASIAKLKRQITPHDLRHSHAIYLLERGASIDEIALQLRNTVAVCQQYYLGFQHTTGTLERLKRNIG